MNLLSILKENENDLARWNSLFCNVLWMSHKSIGNKIDNELKDTRKAKTRYLSEILFVKSALAVAMH